MKKFVHVFENKIVNRYEALKSTIFGGPWSEGESIEVETDDLELLVYKGVDEEGMHLFSHKEAPFVSYEELRKLHYPDVFEYIDGIVKGNQSQIDVYIQKCKDVKAKFPKPKSK